MDQLIVFFIAVLTSSMFIIGVHAFIKKVIVEELLSYDMEHWWDELPRGKKLIFKPLFACPYCMASVWGTLIFWVVFPYMGFLLWVPFCLCICGLNYFAVQFFNE